MLSLSIQYPWRRWQTTEGMSFIWSDPSPEPNLHRGRNGTNNSSKTLQKCFPALGTCTKMNSEKYCQLRIGNLGFGSNPNEDFCWLIGPLDVCNSSKVRVRRNESTRQGERKLPIDEHYGVPQENSKPQSPSAVTIQMLSSPAAQVINTMPSKPFV